MTAPFLYPGRGCRALLFVTAAFAACSDVDGSEVASRRDVGGTDDARVATDTPAIATAPPKSTALCGLPPPMVGVRPPAVKMGSVHAADEQPMGEVLDIGGGKWTLINIWASHCKACLQDMPLLKLWEVKLAERLRVVFVSVDDDQRAAVRVMASQPKTGVRRSYHLDDVVAREEWMSSIGVPQTLPVQVLVDPEGVVQCVAIRVVGATDLPEIEALVSRPR